MDATGEREKGMTCANLQEIGAHVDTPSDADVLCYPSSPYYLRLSFVQSLCHLVLVSQHVG